MADLTIKPYDQGDRRVWRVSHDGMSVTGSGRIGFEGTRCSNIMKVVARIFSFLGFGYLVRINGKFENETKPRNHYFWINKKEWDGYEREVTQGSVVANRINIYARHMFGQNIEEHSKKSQ